MSYIYNMERPKCTCPRCRFAVVNSQPRRSAHENSELSDEEDGCLPQLYTAIEKKQTADCKNKVIDTEKTTDKIIEVIKTENTADQTIEVLNTEKPVDQIIEVINTEKPVDQTIEVINTKKPVDQTIEVINTEKPVDQTIEVIKTENTADQTIEVINTKKTVDQTIEVINTEKPVDQTIEVINTEKPVDQTIEVINTEKTADLKIVDIKTPISIIDTKILSTKIISEPQLKKTTVHGGMESFVGPIPVGWSSDTPYLVSREDGYGLVHSGRSSVRLRDGARLSFTAVNTGTTGSTLSFFALGTGRQTGLNVKVYYMSPDGERECAFLFIRKGDLPQVKSGFGYYVFDIPPVPSEINNYRIEFSASTSRRQCVLLDDIAFN